MLHIPLDSIRALRGQPQAAVRNFSIEPDGSFNVTKGAALVNAYEKLRPLTPNEFAALPVLARGAALRFALTRLVDWLNVPQGALVRPKDPLEYVRKLRFHQRIDSARDLGLTA